MGPIDPNNPIWHWMKDPKNANLVKSLEQWIERFKAAVAKKDYTAARNFLNTIKGLVKKPPPEVLEELGQMLKALREELGIAEEVAEIVGGIGEGAGALTAGAWLAILALVVVLVCCCASAGHTEELTPDERRKKTREAIKELFSNLPSDPTVNPALDLSRRAQEFKNEMRKKCLCAHSQLSQLGGNIEGRELAFASVPPMAPTATGGPGGSTAYPSSGTNGPGGASGASGGTKPHGGRPDPFQLPSKGGLPMHLPSKSKSGKPGDVLPFKPPPGKCAWPDCPSGKRTKSA